MCSETPTWSWHAGVTEVTFFQKMAHFVWPCRLLSPSCLCGPEKCKDFIENYIPSTGRQLKYMQIVV